MSENNEWLQGLKVGDEVAIRHNSFGSGYYDFTKIDKITKAHFVIRGTKYRRDSGRQAGETWHPSYMHQATPELKQEVATVRRLNQLGKQLEETKWRSLPIETLEAITVLISNNGDKQ